VRLGKYPKTFIPVAEDVKCRQRARVAIMKIQRGIKEILLSDNPDNVYYELEKIRELDNQVLENFEIIKSNSGGNEEIEKLVNESTEIFDEWRKPGGNCGSDTAKQTFTRYNCSYSKK